MATQVSDLVGRDEEIAAITELLEAPPGVLLIDGEAGIGKTTLWQRGVELALGRSLRVLSASPAPTETHLVYAALRDLLEDVFDDVAATLPPPQRRALDVALLRASPGGNPPAQEAVAAAFLGALRAGARSGGLLVAIDDIQWLDSSSALVLGFCARRLRDEPISLLIATRTEPPPPSLLLDRLDATKLTRRTLGPLAIGALNRLLTDRLGASLPRPTLRAVHELSRGNPFFALEIARVLPPAGWTPTPGKPLPVPSTLRSLVETRIAGLPGGTRLALAVAAAAADPTVSIVSACVERDGATALAPAVEEGVIRLDGERVRFAHPLFAAAAYERATPRDRHHLHAELSRLLDDPEERARHLALTAEEPDEGIAQALEEAARTAFARGAAQSAVDLCDQARRLTPAQNATGLRRRALAQVEYCIHTGESARARELIEVILAGSPPGHMRAEALSYLGWIALFGVDWRSALEFYSAAVAEPGVSDVVRARSELGVAHSMFLLRKDMKRAAEHVRAAVLAAERTQDSRLLADALAARAEMEFLLGAETFPIESLDRALATEAALGARTVAEGPQAMLALITSWADDLDTSLALYTNVCSRAAELGDETSHEWALARTAFVECLLGSFGDATAHLDEAGEIVALTGHETNRAVVLATRALVEAYLGNIDAAQANGTGALRLAAETAATHAERIAHSALGLLALSLGQLETTHVHLAGLMVEVRSASIREPSEFRSLPDHIEALIGLERFEEAAEELAFLEECAHLTKRKSAVGAARRCRALFAATRGDPTGAVASASDAVTLHASVPMPFEHARSLLTLGVVQRRAKQRRDARQSLERALASFERLGVLIWAERARAEIARIGGRRRQGDELTETERRVAEIVAEGKTNSEVAAELFVTRKTVEFHLRNVFRKLEVRSRAELARKFSVKS